MSVLVTSHAQAARPHLLRRVAWTTGIVGLLILAAIITVNLAVPADNYVLGPNNAQADGARALAQVLRDQGVQVTSTTSFAQARSLAKDGSTLLIVGTYELDYDQLTELAGTKADLVLVEPQFDALEVLSDNSIETVSEPSLEGTKAKANCQDPDALAVGSMRLSDQQLELPAASKAEMCFTAPGASDVGFFARTEANGRTVTAVPDGTPFTNAHIATDANAALALRMLGQNRDLTWYIPTWEYDDSGNPSIWSLTPPWAPLVAVMLLIAAAVAAIWRGRRFGRLVTEPLPVTVRAIETTLGRGRLYRRGHSVAHAGATLRAATARRLAAWLGLPSSAPPESLITAVAAATARSGEEIRALLYGPAPSSAEELLALSNQLEHLESEVFRP